MTHDPEDTDARLERLKLATGSIRPRPSFAARVVAAASREEASGDWTFDLVLAARRLVPIAALAAAVGMIWAVQSEHAWNQARTRNASMELDLQW
jgi:hypothetical protein